MEKKRGEYEAHYTVEQLHAGRPILVVYGADF